MKDTLQSMVAYFDEYGSPEVLQLATVNVPPPAEGEVRVVVRAISVNPADWMVIAGFFKDHMPMVPSQVAGVECAGFVELVGPGVTRFASGDRVIRQGSFDAYRQVGNYPESELQLIPDGIDFEQAACLTVAGRTAYAAVRQLRITSTDTLLVHAAAGGVGAAVVQIATNLGARVIGTASPNNHDYLRSIGALPVSYKENLVADITRLGPITASFDGACREESIATTATVLKDLSRALVALDSTFARAAGIKMVDRSTDKQDTYDLLELSLDRKLIFEIDKIYPLSKAREALEYSRHGHLRGKIILRPDHV